MFKDLKKSNIEKTMEKMDIMDNFNKLNDNDYSINDNDYSINDNNNINDNDYNL